MRVHANYPVSIREARERLEAGTGSLHITGGLIRRGPAVDTTYIFHLYPGYLQARLAEERFDSPVRI